MQAKQYPLVKVNPPSFKSYFFLPTAQDAFIKIGKSLQKRRKTDLYETVSYFTGTDADPAQSDTQLQTKLIDNQKYHSRINEIIDKYVSIVF